MQKKLCMCLLLLLLFNYFFERTGLFVLIYLKKKDWKRFKENIKCKKKEINKNTDL